MITQHLADTDSMLASVADPQRAPEMLAVREAVRGWRFYDHFRADSDSPARNAQIGTSTPVLDHDGANLAAALQTILEIRSDEALSTAIQDAFPAADYPLRWNMAPSSCNCTNMDCCVRFLRRNCQTVPYDTSCGRRPCSLRDHRN